MTDVPASRRRAILVVDDEPEALGLFKRILAAEDAEILTAPTGAEALKIARGTRLDLVILDIKLPDVSGTEVLRRLRKIDDSVPIIMVTSYGSPESVRAAMELGAFDYLTKPFETQEVRRAAREALRIRARRAVAAEAPRDRR